MTHFVGHEATVFEGRNETSSNIRCTNFLSFWVILDVFRRRLLHTIVSSHTVCKLSVCFRNVGYCTWRRTSVSAEKRMEYCLNLTSEFSTWFFSPSAARLSLPRQQISQTAPRVYMTGKSRFISQRKRRFCVLRRVPAKSEPIQTPVQWPPRGLRRGKVWRWPATWNECWM